MGCSSLRTSQVDYFWKLIYYPQIQPVTSLAVVGRLRIILKHPSGGGGFNDPLSE